MLELQRARIVPTTYQEQDLMTAWLTYQKRANNVVK